MQSLKILQTDSAKTKYFMRLRDLFKEVTEQDLEDWQASRSLCKSSKPNSALGASALASCKVKAIADVKATKVTN